MLAVSESNFDDIYYSPSFKQKTFWAVVDYTIYSNTSPPVGANFHAVNQMFLSELRQPGDKMFLTTAQFDIPVGTQFTLTIKSGPPDATYYNTSLSSFSVLSAETRTQQGGGDIKITVY